MKSKTKTLPTDAVLHLLYSRFWHKVLFDLGLVSTKDVCLAAQNGALFARQHNSFSFMIRFIFGQMALRSARARA